MTSNFLSLPGQEVHLSALEATYITANTSPERIRLFFTNFSLGSVLQYNANSIILYRYNANCSAIVSISWVSNLTSYRAHLTAISMTL